MFYFYLLKDSNGIFFLYYILKFDVVLLNKGNGYNVFDGIFIVLVLGMYVFMWLFMLEVYGYVYIEFMKNFDIIGMWYVDFIIIIVWDFVIGVVVVDVF